MYSKLSTIEDINILQIFPSDSPVRPTECEH